MARKLRVVIAGPYPREDGKIVGGVEGVTAALCDGLACVDGVEVHVMTGVRGVDGVIERRTRSGVLVHSILSPNRLAWLAGFPVERRLFRQVLESVNPDIVHCHTQTVYPHAVLERGWPSLLTIHGVYYREVAHLHGWPHFQGLMVSRFERDAIRRARHIVCINRYLSDAFGHMFRTEDIRFIDNPIDDRYFRVASAVEPMRLLYGGTIMNRKNLMVLLKAVRMLAAKHPDLKLRVAGSKSIETHYYQRCVDYVEENALGRNVDFLGAISMNSMMEELGAANMLVLPSMQETAPMIISEAMAAGKPVVATPAGGTADMVEDGKAGFIVPFDDEVALAGSIEKLLVDADLRAKMGGFARQVAQERFKSSVVVEKTLAFYDDILSLGR